MDQLDELLQEKWLRSDPRLYWSLLRFSDANDDKKNHRRLKEKSSLQLLPFFDFAKFSIAEGLRLLPPVDFVQLKQC